jgi:hypothetical protein
VEQQDAVAMVAGGSSSGRAPEAPMSDDTSRAARPELQARQGVLTHKGWTAAALPHAQAGGCGELSSGGREEREGEGGADGEASASS